MQNIQGRTGQDCGAVLGSVPANNQIVTRSPSPLPRLERYIREVRSDLDCVIHVNNEDSLFILIQQLLKRIHQMKNYTHYEIGCLLTDIHHLHPCKGKQVEIKLCNEAGK